MHSNKSSTKRLEDFVSKHEMDRQMIQGHYSHGIHIVMKKSPSHMQAAMTKYKTPWFLKKVPKMEAYREVVAQEFFRLLFPHYPKTRVLKHGDDFYVLSKGIPGFRGVDRAAEANLNSQINNGSVTGLGHLVLISLLGEEIDLKYGNQGIDAKGRIIKIDGGYCFATLTQFSAQRFTITPHEIAALPYLHSRYAYNWLDAIENQVKMAHPQTLDQSMTLDDHPVKKEINQAMLYALILSEELIDKFVSAYAPDKILATTISITLKNKLTELRMSAIKNPSFCRYMASKAAANDFALQLERIKIFKTTNQNVLANHVSTLENDARRLFAALQSGTPSSQIASRPNTPAQSSMAVSTSSSKMTPTDARPYVLQVQPGELIGDISDEDVKAILVCIETELQKKITKNKATFTFRDKILEAKRNEIWQTLTKSQHMQPIILQATLVHAITENIIATRTRYKETHSDKDLQDTKLDLGKIYEKMASKLLTISPALFKTIIKSVALQTGISSPDIFLKGVLDKNQKNYNVNQLFLENELNNFKTDVYSHLQLRNRGTHR
jgi:hypothetical protein